MLREQIHAPLSLQDGWLGNLRRGPIGSVSASSCIFIVANGGRPHCVCGCVSRVTLYMECLLFFISFLHLQAYSRDRELRRIWMRVPGLVKASGEREVSAFLPYYVFEYNDKMWLLHGL